MKAQRLLAFALAAALAGCGQHQSVVPAQASGALNVKQHQEQILYSFSGSRRGGLPVAGLVEGDSGQMYGATRFGGSGGCNDVYPGCGIVFELTLDGNGFKESTAYSFQNKGDGSGPIVLVRDNRGTLYGLTSNDSSPETQPVLFRLDPSGDRFIETTLHQFAGEEPTGLTLSRDGYLYGTDAYVGSTYGKIFRFKSGNGFKEQILYQFPNLSTGADPRSPLIVDSSGVIYGTTDVGGTGTASECLGVGCGTIFKLTPSANGYKETVLYNFTGKDDGALPNAPVLDGSKTLYGSAVLSGGSACIDGGCGTLFSFSLATRKLKILYTFTRIGLWSPDSQLALDRTGALYGTTSQNGDGIASNGGVFKLKHTNRGFVESTIHTFAGSPDDGQFPRGGLLLGPGKALYGTTYWGGKGAGTIFQVSN